jgi:hypothetical protein
MYNQFYNKYQEERENLGVLDIGGFNDINLEWTEMTYDMV